MLRKRRRGLTDISCRPADDQDRPDIRTHNCRLGYCISIHTPNQFHDGVAVWLQDISDGHDEDGHAPTNEQIHPNTPLLHALGRIDGAVIDVQDVAE